MLIAAAQTATAQTAQTAPAPAAAAYTDRLIAGGDLPVDTTSPEQSRYDSRGNLRSLVVELGGSTIAPRSHSSQFDLAALDRVQKEAGISISGRYQTSDFGTLGLDAQLRYGSNARALGSNANRQGLAGSATVSDRGLPLGKGWLADGDVGMTSAAAVPLVRQQARFFIPTVPIAGGAATMRAFGHATKGGKEPEPVAVVNAAVGEPGLMGGLRLGDFSGLSGVLATAGAQARISSRLAAGLQGIVLANTRDPYATVLGSPAGSVGRLSSRGLLGTVVVNTGGLRLQGNALWSDQRTRGANRTTSSAKAGGAWLDASFRTGRAVHSGGFYYFDPDLAWGNSAIVNNAYGAYYRVASFSQRWRWSLNFDLAHSVRRGGTRGAIVNADVRRQLSFKTSVGANAAFRTVNGYQSSQILGFVELATRLGATRLESGWSHDPTADLLRAGWDQSWTLPGWLPSGSRLSSQISYDRLRTRAAASGRHASSGSVAGAVTIGISPWSAVTLDATLAYKSDGGTSIASVYGPVDSTGGPLGVLASQRGRAFSGNVVANARLSDHWNLSASLTSTRTSLATRYGLANPAGSPLGIGASDLAQRRRDSFRLRAGYLTLRYSISAGRRPARIGLPEFAVGGAGALEGRVFLDANSNGRRDPNEEGAAGIVVYLDGLYAVRTDPAGYYRFDAVADGPHRITLNFDALPLPWTIGRMSEDGSVPVFLRTVDIGVRETSHLDIAATRE